MAGIARSVVAVSALILWAGCDAVDATKQSGAAGDTAALDDGQLDNDGDGFVAAEDCDDEDPSVNSGATEVCDGLDNDCDGEVDEGVLDRFYTDADGDGYGDPEALEEACAQPEGAVTSATDCDDTDAAIFPSAREVCDGLDNDCDGLVDEDSAHEWFRDADGDGFGDSSDTVIDCSQPEGYVAEGGDCDDAEATVNPAAEDVCNDVDDDCDGSIDNGTRQVYYRDADGDGYGWPDETTVDCEPPPGYVTNVDDCDDTDAAVNPAAQEVCNGTDDDCDALVDDADPSLDGSTAGTWYADADGDGYGDAATAITACVQPSGSVTDTSDCDDGDAAVNPAASEICNSIDDDCDGLVDDDDSSWDTTTGGTWYTDADGDGYGDASSAMTGCVQPSGSVTDTSDCDDGDAAVNPAASEICNSIDDDCDGLVDDDDSSVDTSAGGTWYADADADGYGDASAPTDACAQPSGTVTDSSDCDDGDAAVSPGATEICNSIDDDCDGLTDDDDSDLDASTATTWYLDSDLDGYGVPTSSVQSCDEPSGYTSDDTDCDDADSDINPGASEVCNGYDDDCDLVADDGGDCPCAVEYYSGDTTHPYMFCTSGASWTSGSANCNTYGYELVTINDSAENSWVDSTADTYSTAKWWTGINDRASEGSFRWASGEPVTYTRWASGEPNNSGGNEDCGQLNRYHPAQTWNDEPCGSSFRYICEAW